MARRKSSNNNDIRIAVSILIFLVVALGVYLFFQAKKQVSKISPKDKVVTEKQSPKKMTTSGSLKQPVLKEPVISKKSPVVVKQSPVVSVNPYPKGAGKIAIILDDFGQSIKNCRYLTEIPDDIAVAILPALPATDDIAKCAQDNKKTIMLHLPMEPHRNDDVYPTDYIIKPTMEASKVERILMGYLMKMPYVQGVNNHMGSKATEDKALMTTILRRLKKRNLFFVDSLTAKNSVGKQVAKDTGVMFALRDVFLDNENTREAIVAQLVLLAQKANQKGQAIAIGHDRSLTFQVLKDELPKLKASGYTIVSIKDLLKKQ
jgi:polysaccharide deacetylase 2 family uncharacterized protein YibQ